MFHGLVGDAPEGRGVGEADVGVQRRERPGAGEVAVVERHPGGVEVGIVGLRPVDRLVAFDVGDDVAGVVGDDVEEDVDAERVGRSDETLHLGVGAEVGVDLRVVDLPVAVVAGGGSADGAVALHPAVLELRGEPDGSDAEVVEVGEAGGEAGQVAAVVVALVGGQQTVDQRIAAEVSAGIVGGVAVLEAVGHDEVEDVVLGGNADGIAYQQLVPGLGGAALTHLNAEQVAHRVVAEGDVLERARHAEGDVGAVLDAAGAVVLGPVFVMGHLGFVVAAGQQSRDHVEAVAVGVLQPGAQAPRLPVAGAAQLVLEAAGDGGDGRVDVVGDPVGAVVVVELDVGRGSQVEADVGAVAGGVGPVVLVPRVVERRLVLPCPGRHVEGPLPDGVLGVEHQVRRGAVGLPVAGTAQLCLQAAGDGHAARLRRRRRIADGQDLGGVVEREEHKLEGRIDGEGDVGAVLDAAGAVVDVPGLVDGHLGLVAAAGQRRGEGEDAVAVGVLEPGSQAARVPVPGAPQLALEAARGHGNHRIDVVGDPVGGMGVVELDVCEGP